MKIKICNKCNQIQSKVKINAEAGMVCSACWQRVTAKQAWNNVKPAIDAWKNAKRMYCDV